MSEDRVSVVVTGTAWMGSGIGSIESAVERLFREAEQEILLAVYTISAGADILLDWLEAALARGVRISFIANRLHDQPHEPVSRLRQLMRTYPHLHLYEFVNEERADLHAKAIVVDRRLALVGSSNLTYRGLSANHELALLIEGSSATDVASAIDCLVASNFVVRIQN